MIKIFNKVHFDIVIDGHTFKPFEFTHMNVTHEFHKKIRQHKEYLTTSVVNANDYKNTYNLKEGNRVNFCFDIYHGIGGSYKNVVKSFSTPIMKHLKITNDFSNRPLLYWNCRFFNSQRIRQQGKAPVGPKDIFISHGIGDKNYWTGNKIKDFKYAFVPGPKWEKRMRDTAYKGEIFIVGYTKLDPIINGELKKKDRKKPLIVWAPTHGYNNKHKQRSSYPQCVNLIKKINYDTQLALHPTSNKNKNVTMQQLVDADVVISDSGSTLYEAWILGKPVIFPDWICKNDILKHFENDINNFEYQIYKNEIGYHAKNMSHLNKLIEIALSDGMKDEEKEFINDIYPNNIRGKAGQLSADALEFLSNNSK